jgi:hypothetical protein
MEATCEERKHSDVVGKGLQSGRERETPRACARWSYAQAFFSPPPAAAVPSYTELTLWIFGSPICVRLVVSIRYLVVICLKRFV